MCRVHDTQPSCAPRNGVCARLAQAECSTWNIPSIPGEWGSRSVGQQLPLWLFSALKRAPRQGPCQQQREHGYPDTGWAPPASTASPRVRCADLQI